MAEQQHTSHSASCGKPIKKAGQLETSQSASFRQPKEAGKLETRQNNSIHLSPLLEGSLRKQVNKRHDRQQHTSQSASCRQPREA